MAAAIIARAPPTIHPILPPRQRAKSVRGIHSKVHIFFQLSLLILETYRFIFGSTTLIAFLFYFCCLPTFRPSLSHSLSPLFNTFFPHCSLFFLFVLLASSRKRRKGNGSGSSNQEPQPKNAVAILNELKKNLVYELESQEGPYHAPVFTMSVMVSTLSIFFLHNLVIFFLLSFIHLYRLTVKSMLVRESPRSWLELMPRQVH